MTKRIIAKRSQNDVGCAPKKRGKNSPANNIIQLRPSGMMGMAACVKKIIKRQNHVHKEMGNKKGVPGTKHFHALRKPNRRNQPIGKKEQIRHQRRRPKK